MIISIIILSTLLLLTTVGVVVLEIECMAIDHSFGFVFLIGTIILAITTYYFPIKKALKTGKKKYLLYMLITIVLFLGIIIFRNQIRDFWYELFSPIGPTIPVLPPEL